jgi:hypothetical protein
MWSLRKSYPKVAARATAALDPRMRGNDMYGMASNAHPREPRAACQRADFPYASNSGPRDAAKILRNALSPPAPGMRKLGWA